MSAKLHLLSGLLKLSFVLLFSRLMSMAVYAEEKPNILFISIDDMNDVPNFMGSYKGAITPNMDKLAAKGVVFTQAHCQYPICGPSRASMMSGLLATTLGYTRHPKDDAVQKKALKLGSSTIPLHFKNNGYKVMAAGKLFHKHLPKGSYHMSNGRGGWGAYPKGKRRYKTKGTLTDWGVTHEKEEKMSDAQAASWVVKRLGESHDKPFLLMFGTIRPHVPWLVPQKYFDMYPNPKELTLMPYKKDDFDDIPKRAKELGVLPVMPRTDWLIEQDEWHNMMQAYLASVTFADHCIGQVLDALEKSPYAKNTIIVLWSDHGYHLGEKNTTQKHSLWQRSSHVPMIIAGPGIAPGRSPRAVGLIDIFPTLTDLTGLEGFDAWEGRSLAPLLENPEKEWPYPVITTWMGPNCAVQTETHRYMCYDDGSEELYDHTKDLNEWTNLAGDPEYAQIKAELAKAMPNLDGVPIPKDNHGKKKGKKKRKDRE